MIFSRARSPRPRRTVLLRHARVAGVVLLLLGLALACLVWGPVPAVDAHAFNHDRNGLWLGHRWFDGRAGRRDVRTLAMQVRESGIQDLYVHVGPLDATGDIPHWDPAVWRATLQSIRELMPGVQVYAWLGGVTTDSYGVAPDTVDLSSVPVRRAMVATARHLVEAGDFDGIHYDLELVPNDNPGFLYLLEATRRTLPRRLSVAAPIIHPPFIPVNNLWTRDYFRTVAEHCDQIAVMAYDTMMPTETLYKRMLAWQVKAACDSAAGTGCQLIFGVPTYKEKTAAHNPRAEHLTSALDGIAWGVQQAAFPQVFQGVAVYAEWTTQPVEWHELAQRWSCRN